MSAFRRPQERNNTIRVPASEYHLVAKASGGIDQLFKQIKSNTVPQLQDYGSYTDIHGHFEVSNEDPPLLALRYQYKGVLGTGQSAVVIRAKDLFCGGRLVAIKILHSHYYELGFQETDSYHRLQAADPFGFTPICRLLNTFSFDGHYCMVFELFRSPNWTQFFHSGNRLTHAEAMYAKTRKVTLRLLQVLGFLQTQNIIHADLKPDNLLLKSEGDVSSLCVADFGNAIHCTYQEVSLYYDDFDLQALVYRAPEVIFGLQFGCEIDVWSVGCIIAEFVLGKPLFYASTRQEVLQEMVRLLGPVPRSLVQRGKFYQDLEMYTSSGTQLDATSKLLSMLKTSTAGRCSGHLYALASFLAQLLRYDPAERLSITEAACHPFLAPEMGLAYLIPVASGESRQYPSILVPKKLYPHKPHIDKEILGRHPSTFDLLSMGTSSTTQTDTECKRRVAQVSPLGFSTTSSEQEKIEEERKRPEQAANRSQEEMPPRPATVAGVSRGEIRQKSPHRSTQGITESNLGTNRVSVRKKSQKAVLGVAQGIPKAATEGHSHDGQNAHMRTQKKCEEPTQGLEMSNSSEFPESVESKPSKAALASSSKDMLSRGKGSGEYSEPEIESKNLQIPKQKILDSSSDINPKLRGKKCRNATLVKNHTNPLSDKEDSTHNSDQEAVHEKELRTVQQDKTSRSHPDLAPRKRSLKPIVVNSHTDSLSSSSTEDSHADLNCRVSKREHILSEEGSGEDSSPEATQKTPQRPIQRIAKSNSCKNPKSGGEKYQKTTLYNNHGNQHSQGEESVYNSRVVVEEERPERTLQESRTSRSKAGQAPKRRRSQKTIIVNSHSNSLPPQKDSAEHSGPKFVQRDPHRREHKAEASGSVEDFKSQKAILVSYVESRLPLEASSGEHSGPDITEKNPQRPIQRVRKSNSDTKPKSCRKKSREAIVINSSQSETEETAYHSGPDVKQERCKTLSSSEGRRSQQAPRRLISQLEAEEIGYDSDLEINQDRFQKMSRREAGLSAINSKDRRRTSKAVLANKLLHTDYRTEDSGTETEHKRSQRSALRDRTPCRDAESMIWGKKSKKEILVNKLSEPESSSGPTVPQKCSQKSTSSDAELKSEEPKQKKAKYASKLSNIQEDFFASNVSSQSSQSVKTVEMLSTSRKGNKCKSPGYGKSSAKKVRKRRNHGMGTVECQIQAELSQEEMANCDTPNKMILSGDLAASYDFDCTSRAGSGEKQVIKVAAGTKKDTSVRTSGKTIISAKQSTCKAEKSPRMKGCENDSFCTQHSSFSESMLKIPSPTVKKNDAVCNSKYIYEKSLSSKREVKSCELYNFSASPELGLKSCLKPDSLLEMSGYTAPQQQRLLKLPKSFSSVKTEPTDSSQQNFRDSPQKIAPNKKSPRRLLFSRRSQLSSTSTSKYQTTDINTSDKHLRTDIGNIISSSVNQEKDIIKSDGLFSDTSDEHSSPEKISWRQLDGSYSKPIHPKADTELCSTEDNICQAKTTQSRQVLLGSKDKTSLYKNLNKRQSFPAVLDRSRVHEASKKQEPLVELSGYTNPQERRLFKISKNSSIFRAEPTNHSQLSSIENHKKCTPSKKHRRNPSPKRLPQSYSSTVSSSSGRLADGHSQMTSPIPPPNSNPLLSGFRSENLLKIGSDSSDSTIHDSDEELILLDLWCPDKDDGRRL